MSARLGLAGIVAGVFVAVAAGCGGGDDKDCGPGDAPPDGVIVAFDGREVRYGNFTSSPNNDCSPMPGRIPTSLTLDGKDPSGFYLTLCLPRPEDLGGGAVALDNTELVQVEDVSADLGDGCAMILDRDVAVSGTIEFLGYCGDGLDPSGYAIAIEGSLGGVIVCDGVEMESVSVEIRGSAAVEVPQS